MVSEEVIQKLINGDTVYLKSTEERREIRNRLREIKKNCTIVLSQLKEQL